MSIKLPAISLLFLISQSFLMTPIQGQDGLPNIVLIVADDIGYGETGMQGNDQIPTPHIDAIAAQGVRFTKGYVTAPYCSPSRAGLLTGRIQNRFGYDYNPTGFRNENPALGLPLEEKTIPELLLPAGYISGIIGKWHLGASPERHPFHHGFDEFFGFLHEGHYYAPWPFEGATTMLRRTTLPGGGKGRWISDNGRLIYHTTMGHNEPDYNANNPLVRGSQPQKETQFLTEAFTREALDFIDRHQDKPFFLYLPYNAVHSPLQSKNEFVDRFTSIADVQRRIFAGMLTELDESIGQIVDKLIQKQLEDNTIIIFLSDNGGPTKELTSSNAPLRGGKGNLYEGGIRVPFAIQWKNKLSPGQVFSHTVSTLDILPTLLAAVQQPVPEDIDGVDLLPYIQGDTDQAPHDQLFWETPTYSALIKDQWKIIRHKRNASGWELYHIYEDPEESRDLANGYHSKKMELVKLWQKTLAEINQ